MTEQRLIDANELLTAFPCGETVRTECLRATIGHMPTIEERKKGKWVWLSSTYDRVPCEMRFMCSDCHHEVITHDCRPWEKFCPNCGVQMGIES